MKKLELKAMNLDVLEILSREQLKHVIGADGSGEGSGSGGSGGVKTCSNDRFCTMYQPRDGGCKTMENGQCRCVKYSNGSASESVPDSNCIA